MNHKGFSISAFEQEPGKWRARISRASGRRFSSAGRKLRGYLISDDQSSASAAVKMAMDAIDAGYFSRKFERRVEKYWRMNTSSD